MPLVIINCVSKYRNQPVRYKYIILQLIIMFFILYPSISVSHSSKLSSLTLASKEQNISVPFYLKLHILPLYNMIFQSLVFSYKRLRMLTNSYLWIIRDNTNCVFFLRMLHM